MRLGIVRGHVVLNQASPELRGTRFLIVEPMTAESLAKQDGSAGGKPLIVADDLGPGRGQLIAFTEGGEAANPYWPRRVPVDAYCTMIVDHADYRMTAAPVDAAKGNA